MKKGAAIKLVMAGVLGLGLAVTATVPANAINTVSCGSRTDFLKFNTSGGATCYEYAGTATDELYFATYTSGNNAGFFTWRGRGDVYFAKWSGLSYASVVDASVEHIN